MKEQEDFIIQVPYRPSERETKAITELTKKGLEPSDWESRKVGILSFKDNLREHMWHEQNFRCAYCRIEIPLACCFLQREHIVPKALHPKWMFEPRNLCFTCDRCNNYKNDKEVISNYTREDYPVSSENFLIVNPYIDKYSDHINLVNDLIYEGKTDKGYFTIDTCQLSRLDLPLERARRKMEKENPSAVMAQLLSLLSARQITQDEIKNIKRKIENIVKRYKSYFDSDSTERNM